MFRSQALAVLVGAALFAVGSWCLYDAWERRGAKTPLLVKPYVPW
jgi:hypothetical protein